MVTATKVGIERQVGTHRAPSIPTRRRALAHLEDKYMRLTLDSLEDYEIVELLLSLASPRSEHKKRAIECMKQFGSLRGLIEASPQELQQHDITPRALLLIRLMSEIPVRVLKQKVADKPVYHSSQAVFDYLCYSMRGLKNEVFKVIHLNRRNQIIQIADLFEGTVDNISVYHREIVEGAIKCRAASMIYAHNHPSGDPIPSRSDKRLTRDLVFIGSILQIRILDHIIVGDNSHFSFADEGLIQRYEDSFLTLRIKANA